MASDDQQDINKANHIKPPAPQPGGSVDLKSLLKLFFPPKKLTMQHFNIHSDTCHLELSSAHS